MVKPLLGFLSEGVSKQTLLRRLDEAEEKQNIRTSLSIFSDLKKQQMMQMLLLKTTNKRVSLIIPDCSEHIVSWFHSCHRLF